MLRYLQPEALEATLSTQKTGSLSIEEMDLPQEIFAWLQRNDITDWNKLSSATWGEFRALGITPKSFRTLFFAYCKLEQRHHQGAPHA